MNKTIMEKLYAVGDYLKNTHKAFVETCGEDDEINTIPAEKALMDFKDVLSNVRKKYEISGHVCSEASELHSLIGFELVNIEDCVGKTEDGDMEIISFTFENKHGVAIDMSYIEGELHISEAYIPGR